MTREAVSRSIGRSSFSSCEDPGGKREKEGTLGVRRKTTRLKTKCTYYGVAKTDGVWKEEGKRHGKLGKANRSGLIIDLSLAPVARQFREITI